MRRLVPLPQGIAIVRVLVGTCPPGKSGGWVRLELNGEARHLFLPLNKLPLHQSDLDTLTPAQVGRWWNRAHGAQGELPHDPDAVRVVS